MQDLELHMRKFGEDVSVLADKSNRKDRTEFLLQKSILNLVDKLNFILYSPIYDNRQPTVQILS